jgi:phosphoenolpyruvate carboxylase
LGTKLQAAEKAGIDKHEILDNIRDISKNLAFPKIMLGDWVGGDRDGHPLVTADVTRNTLLIKGLTGYAAYQREQDQAANYRRIAELERQRVEAYRQFLKDNPV